MSNIDTISGDIEDICFVFGVAILLILVY